MSDISSISSGELRLPAGVVSLLHELKETVAKQGERIARLEAENQALRGENRELRARLGMDSTNSHKPPSTDPKGREKKPPSGKPRGGQGGHPRHTRPLVGEERVDRVEDHFPSECRGCGQELGFPVEVGDYLRHQVTEFPEVRVHITEHRLHQVVCPCCQSRTRAALPPAVPQGAFGPRFVALLAMLCGRFRLSKRETCQLVEALTDTTVSPGAVVKACFHVSTLLEAPYQEVEAAIRRAPVLYVDETSAKEQGQKKWLWVAVSESATLFGIMTHRSRAARIAFLGEPPYGLLVSDRYNAYADIPDHDRGLCHAHLKRDFQALIDRQGSHATWGHEGRALQRELLRLYHQRQQGRLTPAELCLHLEDLKRRWRDFLLRAQLSTLDKVCALASSLLKLFEALFTCLETHGVDPTNNRAERALRPAVLWRKTSFGTQSEEGSRFMERLLTLHATCKQQGRKLFHFLFQLNQAAAAGLPPPTLLPTP